MHYGLDSLGNIINKSFDDKEVYDMPIWQYSQIPVTTANTRDRDAFSKYEKKITGASFVKVYDKPFTSELFSMVTGDDETSKEGAVSMIIARFDQSGGNDR